MMRCPRCGRVYPNGAQFCHECGTPLDYFEQEESKAKKGAIGFLKAICYVILMFAVQDMVSSVLVTAHLLADPTLLMNDVPFEMLMDFRADVIYSNYVMILLVSHLVTILIVSLFFTIRRKNPLDEVGLRPMKWQLAPLCALYGVALYIFISLTIGFLPIPEQLLNDQNEMYAGIFDNTNIVVTILSTTVLTGIVEEMIFRGLAISRLKRGMSRGIAIAVSAVLFGLVHGTLLALCYATVLGIILGFLAERHNSILPTIICHAFYNSVPFFLTTNDPFVILTLYFTSIAVLLLGSYLLFRRPSADEAA